MLEKEVETEVSTAALVIEERLSEELGLEVIINALKIV